MCGPRTWLDGGSAELTAPAQACAMTSYDSTLWIVAPTAWAVALRRGAISVSLVRMASSLSHSATPRTVPAWRFARQYAPLKPLSCRTIGTACS